MIGKTKMTTNPYTRMEEDSMIQKALSTASWVIFTMTAKTNSANVSVITVPPKATFTALFFVTPNLLRIGYTISVWEEKILAKRMAVKSGNSNR